MAKNNSTTAKPKGGEVSLTSDNTPQHKLLALGRNVGGGKADGGKKTKK
ncbi:MAG TPA: hypothetical protein VFM34_06700 [Moraxellaceae bacterium]|nr:hypothetical protein [Moraxellaceae bacterium]